MDDTDLSGLDLAGAKEYIFAYAVDIKRYDRELAQARSELELWRGRIALAEGKSMTQLAVAARSKSDQVQSQISTLEAERAALVVKVARMKEQLPMISARERSIDPDRLLAELQLMTGELLGDSASAEARTAAEFSRLEAESAAETGLDALKKRAAGEDQPES